MNDMHSSVLRCGGNDYEIVNKIPHNFFVWNNEELMGNEDYVPLCELDFTNNFLVNSKTLKAIKLQPSEVKLLRNAAQFAIGSKIDAEHALDKKRGKWFSKQQREFAKATIDIFNRISE